jgi:hypothetical protein
VLKEELNAERNHKVSTNLEAETALKRLTDVQVKNTQLTHELQESRAIAKLQEEQITLLKEELRNLKRGANFQTDLESKVRDLEQTLILQHKASAEKSAQIDQLRGSIRGFEDQIFKAQSELQQVSEDYALRAKRQSLEEDSLKKRLALHD